MKVIQSIEFEPITEDYIKELLRKDIESQLPEGATVTRIDFVRKLNPTRIEAEVLASFGSVPAPTFTPVSEPEPEQIEAVVAGEFKEPVATTPWVADEPEEVKPEDVPETTTLAALFAGAQ